MKKLNFIMVLALLLCASLTSCSSDTQDEPTNNPDFTGIWVQTVTDERESDNFTITYVIKNDGTYVAAERDYTGKLAETYSGVWTYNAKTNCIDFVIVDGGEDFCSLHDIGHFIDRDYNRFYIEYENDDDGIIFEYPFIRQ